MGEGRVGEAGLTGCELVAVVVVKASKGAGEDGLVRVKQASEKAMSMSWQGRRARGDQQRQLRLAQGQGQGKKDSNGGIASVRRERRVQAWVLGGSGPGGWEGDDS